MTITGVSQDRGEPEGLPGDVEPGPVPSPAPPRRRRVKGVPAAWVFPALVAVAVVVPGMLQLSGSSLGLYTTGVGGGEDAAGVLAGPARPIRSDEWNVRTPWALRQAELGLPERVSSAVGRHDVAVLADLPTGGWEGLLRPHTLGYRVLDAERAFAVEWWAYHAVQLLGVYALLMALTRRPLVSALAASLVTLSPATQWWAAPGTFTTVGYGCLAAALVLFAVRAGRAPARWALAAAGGLAVAAFLASLYVPWMIGTAYVVVPTALGAVLASLLDRAGRRRSLRALAVVVPVTLVVGGGLFGAFLVEHREAVEAISGTVYPGDRAAEEGGTARARTVWGAALDYFASQRTNASVNGTNQSENSSGLGLLLPVAAVVGVQGVRGRLRRHPGLYPLLGALLGGAVLLGWALLPVPASLGALALLGRAPPLRMYLPLTLAGAVALALLVHYHLTTGRRPGAAAVLAAAGSFAAAQWWAAGDYTVDGAGVDLVLAGVFVAVVTVATALAVGRRPVPGLAVLVAFSLWQASYINPVQRGTDPLTDNAVRAAVDRAAAGGRPWAGWIVFGGDSLLLGIVTAAGVNNLSGVSPYPDGAAWRLLDPEGRSEQVWNRYTRVAFFAGEAGSETKFVLIQPDSMAITVDPCAPALTALHVEFLVTEDGELAACAQPLERLPLGDGYVVVHRRTAA